jgi:hypothetical protein
MSDDDLKKVLFTLYLLRNKVDDENAKGYAQEMIDLIERHLGVKE